MALPTNELPLTADPLDRDDKTPAGPRGAAAEPSSPVKILVVDDRSENLLAIESVLRNPEYELVKARSGADALRFLLRDDCALILMDVQMPQLDGIETARLIRANERTRAIPIVFVTAMSDEQRYVARGYDAGAIDYLLKPVDPEVLRAKVAGFVELHRAKQEIVRQAALLAEQEKRERQRAVAQLELKNLRRERAAQERYRRLIEGITHAIVWTIDPDTLACTFVSPSAEALIGHPVERWTGGPDSWRALVPQEDRARLLAALRSLSPGEEGAALEHGLVHADGRTLRFETDLRVVPAEEEGRFEVRGFSVDVTDARLAEEALEFLDRSGAALAESLDLATTAETVARLGVPFMADAAVVHVEAVDELPAILAAAHRDPARADALGALVRAAPLAPPREDGRAEVCEDVRRLLPPEAASRAQELLGEGPVRLVSVALRGRDRTVGTLRFVAGPRRDAARELRLAEELGRRAAQALDHALVYRSAQHAVSVRDEFISIASHELRTPLTPLHLQMKALQRGLSDLPEGPRRGTLLERLSTCARQVDRMTRLVANLLDVTRIHAGRLEVDREPMELGELVADVAGRFRDELARGGRRLEVRIAPGIEGSWDRLKLDQVLTNLVSNAVRYGGQGPVSIELRREAGDAVVVVADRGIGIAAEDLSRVFERYHKGMNSRAHGGLGLGLYITRRIVEAHGGTIAVASRLGEGSAFTVCLPLERAR
ncbi:hybrid sensor histidine kinase/response regulator [Anaeromyxobacter terrae]|uniref:hybrid sensor histidine kinase/response regulator n=1 Tax=Anaeromyxobacter terrae TaxID=2925406 RepID=UPI001F57A561|nr:ATP-binding protein [Anaeromyxobacter sp. SG22]